MNITLTPERIGALAQSVGVSAADLQRSFRAGSRIPTKPAITSITNPRRASGWALIQWWCGWALRSRLEPFRALAKTVRQHWEGILAYFNTGLTSAAIEAVNGIIQLAKRMARGFKNFVYFRPAAYLRAARLKFELPPIS